MFHQRRDGLMQICEKLQTGISIDANYKLFFFKLKKLSIVQLPNCIQYLQKFVSLMLTINLKHL